MPQLSLQEIEEFKKLRDDLKNLIARRQAFEKLNPEPPYSNHPTTIDFYDIHNRNSLKYAILLGDLEEAKKLLAEGADPQNQKFGNSTPLTLALRYNQPVIAEYLLENGADISDYPVRDAFIENDDCREIYYHYINKKLNKMTHPEVTKLEFESWKEKYKNPTILEYASALGNEAFLKKFGLKINKSEKFLCIYTAATHGRRELIAKLIDEYNFCYSKKQLGFISDKKAVNSKYIMCASIINRHWKVAEYLLDKGLDLDELDKHSRTPLFHAIINNDMATIKELIARGANYTLQDLINNNIFHTAASTAKLELISYLQTLPESDKMLKQANIYGEIPLDIALRMGNDEVLSALSNQPIDDLRAKSAYNKPKPRINQGRLIDQIGFYLTSRYRDLELYNVAGYCSGLEFVAQKMQGFYRVLELLNSWDGSEGQLKQPIVEDIPGNYKSLEELFETVISQITWHQFSPKLSNAISLDITQRDRVKQLELLGGKFHSRSCFKKDYESFNAEKLMEILEIFFRMPQSTHLEFTNSKHATSACLIDKNIVEYYDPNFTYKTVPFDNADNLGDIILKFTNRLCSIDTDSFTGFIMTYSYPGEIPEEVFDNFKFFSDDELPKTKEEASQFRKKSPNRLSHLDIAVLTHSSANIDSLREGGHCNVNKYCPYLGTPLEIAIRNNDITCVRSLFKFEDIDINFSHRTREAYKYGHHEMVNELLQHPKAKRINGLFKEAIFQNDMAMVEKLIFNEYVDLKDSEDGPELLVFAIRFHQKIDNPDKLMKLLLERKPSLFYSVKPDVLSAKNPIEAAIINNFYVGALIEMLDDLNSFDYTGNTVLYYAAHHKNFELIEKLLEKGADPDYCTKGGISLYYILFSATVSGSEERRQQYANDLFSLIHKQDDMKSIINYINPRNGENFLHVAAHSACAGYLIPRLLDVGIDPEIKNGDGRSPLSLMLDISQYKIYQANIKSLIAMLNKLEAPVEINGIKKAESLSNYYARATDTLQHELASLIKEKISPDVFNMKDSSGNTLLHNTINQSFFSVHDYNKCKALMALGTDINISDNDGKTVADLINESDDEQLKEILKEHQKKAGRGMKL